MRAIQLLATAAMAVFALAERPAAQILTASEVHAAMDARQPADHARLRVHFAALSARYAADADRHTAFARATAAAGRGVNTAAVKHHERLAALATESATVTAELSFHHQALAAGLESTAPLGGETFEAGAGAPAVPSEKRLMQLAARASRPSEHAELREYYLILAREAEASALEHRTMARTYRSLSRVNEPAAANCDRLAKLAAGSAREARALARDHQ